MPYAHLYTLIETADILKVSDETVISLINNAKLDAFKVGSRWRVTGNAIDAYQKRQIEDMKSEINYRLTRNKR
jgi:excisionase family DNA binding protein